ncbi:MAG: tyrosine-type recombinase/integrase [Kiritimatiellae bacterium]|nr:tyrosine-type recombinase/integrase [Kiritimatiellia bacterium]
MALEIKPTSRWWYGRFQVGGKTMLINLEVEVQGNRPLSITQTGDGAFERSRGKAMVEHDRRLADLKNKHNIEELTQRMIEAKTGSRLDTVKIADLPTAWERIPRRRKPSATRAKTCKAILRRFVSFMKDKYPNISEMYEITQPMTRDFLQAEEERGVTARTWNVTLALLRSVFRYLQPEADAYRRHLMNLPGKEEETIHRQPFAPDEIQAILEAARDDEQIFPVIVTALCTAMRKGDCCLLRWKDVDLKNGFITVKTGKTGERVEIPVLPILHDVLRLIPHTRGEYVFPQIAALYKKSSDAPDRKLKLILAKAGFVDGDLADRIRRSPGEILPVLPPKETLRRGLEAINSAKVMRHRRENMRKVFSAYMDGKVTAEISKDLRVSKGTVSGNLRAIEKLIAAQVIRRAQTRVLPAVFRGSIHADSDVGRLKKASVRGWHSFRTTWITLALSAGLPMELVRRVSGHTTTDVVLKHYFKPGREDFRKAIQAAMPRMLTNGEKTRDEQIADIVTNSKRENAWRDIQALKALVHQS